MKAAAAVEGRAIKVAGMIHRHATARITVGMEENLLLPAAGLIQLVDDSTVVETTCVRGAIKITALIEDGSAHRSRTLGVIEAMDDGLDPR